MRCSAELGVVRPHPHTLMITSIIISIASLVIGYFIPIVEDLIRFGRSLKLNDNWISTWQTQGGDPNSWVTETVSIRLGYRRFILKNQDNSSGYDWIGFANVIEKQHLIGHWHSVKPGSQSKGTLMLTFSTQGEYLYGHFLGPNHEGQLNLGLLILARSDKALADAKTFLAKHPELTQQA